MKAHFKYLRYVLIHKWYVFRACVKLGVPLHQAIIHDWQKFTPTEWFAYVNYFYGIKDQDVFDSAWLHHLHYGPHHWQYWLLRQDDGQVKALEMPKRFAKEMVADWIGAGMALGKPDIEGGIKTRVLHENTAYYVSQRIKEAKEKGLIP